jgi:uncharacterized membrane protein
MKQIIDRIAYSFVGIIVLIVLEGMATLGDAFRFEQYTLLGYVFQLMLLFLVVWVSNKMYDADNKLN